MSLTAATIFLGEDEGVTEEMGVAQAKHDMLKCGNHSWPERYFVILFASLPPARVPGEGRTSTLP